MILNFTKKLKFNILIVDDSIDVVDILNQFIINIGYTPLIAYSGQEAIEKIKKNKVDIILLDMVMPKIDGNATLKIIKSIQPDSKVIIITAYHDTEKIMEAMRSGAEECIFKPFDLNLLKLTI